MLRRSTVSTTTPSANPRVQDGGVFTVAHRAVGWLAADPRVRGVGLTLYYLAIIAGLILLYGRGDFSTPSFVYQGF